jgi:hypothetical protein
MRLARTSLSAAAILAAVSGTAMAHHSFAMFAQERPIEIAGTVVEFKYTSPHSFILVEVKGNDGSSTVWNLEGPSPSILARDGMSAKTLKPGRRTGADDRSVAQWRPRRVLEPAQDSIQGRQADHRPIAGSASLLTAIPSARTAA